MIRTVIEVAGHTSFKPFPKSAAGRRTVPLPAGWCRSSANTPSPVAAASNEPIFANEVGAPLRRTLFRTRIWRPVTRAGRDARGCRTVDGAFEARVDRRRRRKHTERLRTERQAVQHVARNQAGGLRFHDLRHSYATWLVDDGSRRTWCSGSWGTNARRRRSTSTPGAPTTATASCRPSDDSRRRGPGRWVGARPRSELRETAPGMLRARSRSCETAWPEALERASDQAVRRWAILGSNQ